MSVFPLTLFFVLFGLGLFGALAVIPYSFNLNPDQLAKAKLPRPVLVLLSLVQSAVLLGVATGVGLLAARATGLDIPYLRSALSGRSAPVPFVQVLPIAIGLGVLVFLVMAACERFVFAPHVPTALRESDARAKLWTRLLASFYGGIDEEILMRLFLVSGLAWLLGRFWQNAAGLPTDGAFWTAIILASVLFGLGHLPATRALTPITPALVVRAIVLNGVAGIACGWLYWRYGLEAAMVAHFSADILLHVLGPLFINRIYNGSSDSKFLPDPNK
jgi:hypothetical protein